MVSIGGSRQIACSAHALAPGESLTIRIQAQRAALGSATDRTTIIGQPHDPTPNDNLATASLNILAPRPVKTVKRNWGQ